MSPAYAYRIYKVSHQSKRVTVTYMKTKRRNGPLDLYKILRTFRHPPNVQRSYHGANSISTCNGRTHTLQIYKQGLSVNQESNSYRPYDIELQNNFILTLSPQIFKQIL